MKRVSVGLLAVVLVAMVLAVAAPVSAHDYQRNRSDHPLRLVAYVLHPIGLGLEYAITRPIHHLVSLPYARFIFGHDPRNERNERGEYPVCLLCRPEIVAKECPQCHKTMQKPRDKYWGLD